MPSNKLNTFILFTNPKLVIRLDYNVFALIRQSFFVSMITQISYIMVYIRGDSMNVIERIHQLRKERGWSVNNLAMEAGLTQSTLSSMLGRNSPPKIETLISLCNAFGITLAQFFSDKEDMEIVTKEEKELIALYRRLPNDKKQALIELIKR